MVMVLRLLIVMIRFGHICNVTDLYSFLMPDFSITGKFTPQ